MISHFTHPGRKMPVNSLEDFLSSPHHDIYFTVGSFQRRAFRDLPNKIFREVWRKSVEGQKDNRKFSYMGSFDDIMDDPRTVLVMGRLFTMQAIASLYSERSGTP